MLFIYRRTVKDGKCAVYINLFYETNSPTNSSELTLSRSPLRVIELPKRVSDQFKRLVKCIIRNASKLSLYSCFAEKETK